MTISEIITQVDHDLSFSASYDPYNDIIEALQDIEFESRIDNLFDMCLEEL